METVTLGDRDPKRWKEQRHVFDTIDLGELKQCAVVERTDSRHSRT